MEKWSGLMGIVIACIALYFSVFEHYVPYSEAASRVHYDEVRAISSLTFYLEQCDELPLSCARNAQSVLAKLEEFKEAVATERENLEPEAYLGFNLSLEMLRSRLAAHEALRRLPKPTYKPDGETPNK